MPTNGLVSHSWQFAGTKTNPQILRMSLKTKDFDCIEMKLKGSEEVLTNE